MNVGEMKKWLGQFPDDTRVDVVITEEGWCGLTKSEKPLEESPESDTWEYLDYTENKFVTPDRSYYKKRYLTLGM